MKTNSFMFGISLALAATLAGVLAVAPPVLAQSTTLLPPPDGLMGWWPAEGDANDIIRGNDGVWQKGVSFVPGIVGQAFSFDGSEAGFVECADQIAGWPEGTLELWFQARQWNWRSATNGLYLWAAAKNAPPNGSQDGIILGNHCGYSPNGQLMFGIFALGSWNWAFSGVTPQRGTWYHLAATWGPAGLCLYVNGELAGTNSYTGAAPSDLNYEIIGHSSWPGSGVNGLVDEVSLYNRALTTSEAQSLFQAGSLGKSRPLGLRINTAISWFAETNHLYQVQWTSKLTTNSWVPLGGPITGTSSNILIFDSAGNRDKRFYRILTLR